MSSQNFEADALFSESELDDFGSDKTEANVILDLRERFDKLPMAQRAALAESLLRMDARTIGLDGDPDEHDYVNDALAQFREAELGKVEDATRDAATKCGLCVEEITVGDPVAERQLVWVTPGSNQVQIREELGERAHVACVKRVKEGGSAEAPLF